MESYESQMKEKQGTDSFNESRLQIPILKYFWQASPLSGSKKSSIHNFLSQISVLNHFSDYEIRLFSQFLHERHFAPGEIIFKEGDGSFGFYLIFSGNIDIYAKRANEETTDQVNKQAMINIASLSKLDYFGELSLLETNTRRNATCVAKDNVTLLAFFKPDLDELIEKYPVVAAKLLQAVSMIVAQRFNSVANQLKITRDKLQKLEQNAAANKKE
jgi:CRP/FNR family cyclic AMP-dependent transcriptional regulator